MRSYTFLALVVPISLTVAAPAPAQATFEDLGPGRALGVSPDGTAVVGIVRASTPGFPADEAFLWTTTSGYTLLGDLPGGAFESRSNDVTRLPGGIVHVGRGAETNGFAGHVNMVGVLGLLGDTYGSDARGVSDDGSRVVGWSVGAFGVEASVWPGTLIAPFGLGDLPGGAFDSRAYRISGDGLVVVGAGTTATGTEAFRYDISTLGPIVGLGDLPGGADFSRALGASTNGAVIVGESSTFDGLNVRLQAVRWTNALGIESLGGPGTSSSANSCSSDGSVIVGRYSGTFSDDAFVWDEAHGMRSLRWVLSNDYLLSASLVNWSLVEATDVSDDGKIVVGWGLGPNGDVRAWRARLELPPLYTYCYGDSFLLCPCGNSVTQGTLSGCTNSLGLGGMLVGSGTPSVGADTLALNASQLPGSTTVVFVQGSTVDGGGFGSPVGDGLRCVLGAIVRLGTKTASAGAASLPGAGDPLISVRGGALPGQSLYYQAYYRNAAFFCTPATFNYTNGVAALWSP